ncbi:peptide/nickel transport system ATP-binding protein [Pseudonocardia sediminis]|uniref:Peptide/nickel transport system ATP-binding protein n=1 Tax=Pseudonocardia sediminis TaxID=1397368 RepID=A0A4Q7V019_PSEST|nr:ATP-binding cassette domain-containing protein [Pseudonocardia sediminis]RZT87772.1 peptide/nickel transport system ATP-binding protein [Pseudonocardia sediminis]
MSVLEIDGLTARAGDAVLLDGIDVTLGPGRVLAVLGPSGAGKSTLGLAVLGEAAPGVVLTGRVRVAGADLLGAGRRRRAGRVGHLPQHPGTVLDPVRRVGRVLDELAALVHPGDRAARAAAVATALTRAGLAPGLGQRFPHQLSGGQQQRMALAQTLVTAPDVIVLDEPTTGLDPGTTDEVLGHLADLARAGTALVLLTHDRSVARRLADRAVALADGRVVRHGSVEDVLGPDHPERPSAAAGPASGDGLEALGLRVVAPGGAVLLDGVDLRAGPGTCVAVAGPSGAGKTTLARAVAGLVTPVTGTVAVDGARLPAALAGRDRAQRRAVQYVHQDARPAFLEHRAVDEQVARPAVLLRGLSPADARAEARAVLERLGVTAAVAARRPGTLSGGQLQRAGVARALLARPGVLVCDEPTSALDTRHRDTLLTELDRHRREHGTVVVLVSHDLDVLRAADRVVHLHDGRAVAPQARVDSSSGGRPAGWNR